MGAPANDIDALVSLADLAEMAGVSRPAVSNWRRRNPDFPSPVAETGATSLFRLRDLRLWMANHGKRLDVRSVDQLVWSALNPARGKVLPEEAAQEGMILLGYLALAFRLGESAPQALRTAIARRDQRSLGSLLVSLDEQAAKLGFGEVFPAGIGIAKSTPSWSFLAKVIDLALDHGVSEAFEALIAAVGRGSRGEGAYSTPSSIADLIMSLAAPISGVVVDPACGLGTFLLAANDAATAPLRLIGQDVNSHACQTARLRMFVHDQPAHIIHGDTLRAGTLFDDTTAMEGSDADLVVADPPMGGKWQPELADRSRMPYGVPPASRADMAWLQDGISRLKPDGFAMFVLPSGAVFRAGTEGEIRCRLIESGCIRAVVALPPALYPTTGISVSLWIVSKPVHSVENRPGGHSVLLIDASQLGRRRRSRTELTETDIATINDCFRAWHTHGQLSSERSLRTAAVPIESLLAGDGNLNPARWIKDPAADPELRIERIAAAERELHAAGAAFSRTFSFSIPPLAAGRPGLSAEGWASSKLTDLATLIRPRRIDPDLIGTGATPLIRSADIGTDLAVTPSGRIDPQIVQGRVEFTLKGDVVVVADGAKLRAAVDHQGGSIIGAPIQVVRPQRDSIDPVVLAAFITSIGPKYAVGTTIRRVDLNALEVPCLDPETTNWLRQTLEALEKQRREALAVARSIDELRTELIDGLSSQAFRLKWPGPGEGGQRW